MNNTEAAEKLEGVLHTAEPALNDDEMQDIGEVIGFLRGDEDGS